MASNLEVTVPVFSILTNRRILRDPNVESSCLGDIQLKHLVKVVKHNAINTNNACNARIQEVEGDLESVRTRRVVHRDRLPNAPPRAVPRIGSAHRQSVDHDPDEAGIHVIKPYRKFQLAGDGRALESGDQGRDLFGSVPEKPRLEGV